MLVFTFTPKNNHGAITCNIFKEAKRDHKKQTLPAMADKRVLEINTQRLRPPKYSYN